MNVGRDKAHDEMIKIIKGEDSFVLHDCVTCYGCEEYCEKGNHPFYLISERREEKGMLVSSRPVTNLFIERGEPKGDYKVGEIKEKALSYCRAGGYLELVKGRFFESISSSYIVGAEFYCQAACLHFAKTSVIKERLPRVIEKVNQLGIKELVCMHDECYGSFTSLASAYNIEVSFKPIHYLEFLYERLWELKSEIRPLNIKAAYQRPCSSRLSSDKCHFVEDIFNLIGVELVERQYQGDKALCCGIMLKDIDRFEIANDVQKRNIDDMIKGKAEYCVFSCTACQKTLSEKVSQKGINPIHIIDLCKIAIGEGTKEGE